MEIIYIIMGIVIATIIIAGVILVYPWLNKSNNELKKRGTFIFSDIFSEDDSNIITALNLEDGPITDEQYRTRGSVRIAQGGGMSLKEYEEEKRKELMIPLP